MTTKIEYLETTVFPNNELINIKQHDIVNLPNGVKISTMCASCKLNTLINITNIEKYMLLNHNDILCVKINKDKMRTLIPEKKKNKRTEININTTNHFYNQITVIVRINEGPVSDILLEPKINLKLFKNGSVQMSGCKNIKDINTVLNKLLFRLKQIKAKVENNKIVEKKFVEDIDSLTVTNFKVDMINSNYKVNMLIDRTKLYLLLTKKKIKSFFEPCNRACVIIKHTPNIDNPDSKEISIFVFQKGNIIITGAKNKNHIISAFDYINNIFLTHYEEIIKNTEEDETIFELYENIIKEVDSGVLSINY